jgi:hypothetical protein
MLVISEKIRKSSNLWYDLKLKAFLAPPKQVQIIESVNRIAQNDYNFPSHSYKSFRKCVGVLQWCRYCVKLLTS